jgi:CheY-like chemotaxis protein
MLSRLLSLKGHEVRTAGDGLEAIDATKRFQPQVVLMDVGMPKLNGYDATRQIRQLDGGQDILIVALTGWGQTGDVQQALEAGCTDHMVKPVDLAALERLLEQNTERLLEQNTERLLEQNTERLLEQNTPVSRR